jgi:hypothetical protein
MLPNGASLHLVRTTLMALALTGAIGFALISLGRKTTTVHAAEGRLDTAETEREAAAVRAAVVVAHAAEARSAAKPALARADSLRARVQIASAGQVRVRSSGSKEATLVPVPPVVTDRLQADSAALSALTVALTWESRTAAAQEEQLVADAKVRDAARITIAELEHERSPRCGRRCGIVLGAAGVVALGLAVDQARRLVHP